MSEPEGISNELKAELDIIASEGVTLAKNEDYEAAIACYRRGFELIPAPREGRFASLWFTTQYGASLDTWRDAIVRYGGFGNPFVHLRRGQALFELGNEKEASNELL